MTTINTIEDLIRLLDEHPEWAEALRVRLLTRDLLELPSKVDALATRVDERFAQVAETIANLAETVDARFAQVAKTIANLAETLDARFAQVAETIANLAETVDARFVQVAETIANLAETVDARFAQVAETIANLAESVDTRFAQVDERFAQVDARFDRVDARLDGMADDIGRLNGFMLESRLHLRVIPLVSQKLGLRRAEILLGPVHGIHPELRDPLEDAVDRREISDDEELRVSVTDFVIRAIRRDTRDPIWVAIEASNGVDSRDIDRVQETANVLASVFGVEAVGMVAGYGIGDPALQRANDENVAWLEVSRS